MLTNGIISFSFNHKEYTKSQENNVYIYYSNNSDSTQIRYNKYSNEFQIENENQWLPFDVKLPDMNDMYLSEVLKASQEFMYIVDDLAFNYRDNTEVDTIRKEHPEYSFVDDEQMDEMLSGAKYRRKELIEQAKELLPDYNEKYSLKEYYDKHLDSRREAKEKQAEY